MFNEVLNVFVAGRPAPKGSLRAVRAPGGRIQQVEEVKASKPWRTAIVNTVVPVIADEVSSQDTIGSRPHWRLREGWPRQLPVMVSVLFRFPRAGTSAATDYPTTRYFGDLDKLCRNVLDALQDAGVYRDDAQVVNLNAIKRFVGDTGEVGSPGARIRVWEIVP